MSKRLDRNVVLLDFSCVLWYNLTIGFQGALASPWLRICCRLFMGVGNTSGLFGNLKIASDKSYKEYLNKYDVVKVNKQEFFSATHDVDGMLKALQKRILTDLKLVYPDYVIEKMVV